MKRFCLQTVLLIFGVAIGSFLQTDFDSVRFAALLSAIRSGDLRGSLKPGML